MGALSKTIKLTGAAVIFAALASLGGCGWQPLYGPTASGAKLGDVMRTVNISTVPGRVGQRVRNELIFDQTGGGERADEFKYRLDIALRESVLNTLVDITGDPNSQVYQLYTQFKLIRLADNQVVMEGRSNARAAYNKVELGVRRYPGEAGCRRPRRAHDLGGDPDAPCDLLFIERLTDRNFGARPWA